MATIFDSEFIDVSTTVLERITGPLPFNVSIRRTENAYTVVFPKGEVLDVPRLKKYQDTKGIQSLYVHNDRAGRSRTCIPIHCGQDSDVIADSVPV
jgi:hypothetical protein